MEHSVEIINYDERMLRKLKECNDFLNGKDAAIEKRDLARAEYEAAERALAEYDDVEYVNKVIDYRDSLKARLGIVDEVVAEAHDEQVVEQVAVAEVASDEIVEHPLV